MLDAGKSKTIIVYKDNTYNITFEYTIIVNINKVPDEEEALELAKNS